MKIKRAFQISLNFLFLIISFAEIDLVNAQDQELSFDKLTIRDGLSHSNVYSIIQDESGYLWFGTQDGLNRYDGREITVFRHEPSNPNSISSGNFGKIFQDRLGFYWFGTFGRGIDLYNPKTNTIKNFSYNPNDASSLSNNQILFIFEDSNGNIWIGTSDGGLNRFNRETESFTRYLHNPNQVNSLSNNRAKCMCETEDGILWIGTGNGLNKFNPSNGTFKHYTHIPSNPKSIGGNIVQNMVSDANGTIWIALRDGGLNHFDPKNEVFTRFTHNPKDPNSISDNQADCIIKDSYSQIWIGTYDGGLNKFDPKTKTFTHFKNNPNKINSISSNRIEFLFEDNAKILWIGTRGSGVSKVDLKPRKFNNITHIPNNPNSLPQHAVMAITSDKKGNIWVGSDGGGVTCYNPQKNTFTHFTHKPNNSNSLSNNRVWCLLFDKDSVLWIGTYLGGLNRMEYKNGVFNITRFLHNPDNKESITHNQVNTLMEDREGNLWVATSNGLNRLDKNGKPATYTFRSYFLEHSDSIVFADNYINSLIQDSKGKIWVGSYQGGLFEFNPKTEKFTPHLMRKQDSIIQSSSLRLLTIFEDSKNNLWIGTESNGVMRFDHEKDIYYPHPNNSILEKNMVIDIAEDNIGNLWICSTRGLSKYSLSDSTFITYTITDGLESDGFNRNAAHLTTDGTLYLGSNSGLTYFSPNTVIDNPFIPKIALTDFKVLNQSIWNKKLVPFGTTHNQGGEIEITHKDYFFSIHFASLDFTNPLKNQYKYKLEGFNDNWVEIGNSTSATFTNLNPGSYTFKVMGSNNDKVWNEVPLELKITIIPPIWKRTWFYLLESLLFILIVLAYIRFRTYSLIRDKRVLEEKVAERTIEINAQKKELENTLDKLKSTQAQLIQSEKMASLGVLTSGIAHEINNPLNYIQGGINALEDYIDENIKDHSEGIAPIIGMIDEGINRASQIVRSLNRFSMNSDTHLESCDIHKIVDNCLLVLLNQIENRIEIRKNYSEKEPFVHGSEAKLHQVFISILINAVQAIADNGVIIVDTQIKNKVVKITITDNGCGISKENLPKIADPFFTTKDPGKGTGLGLSIVYSIIREHNGAINFESEPGMGTSVFVALPLYEK